MPTELEAYHSAAHLADLITAITAVSEATGHTYPPGAIERSSIGYRDWLTDPRGEGDRRWVAIQDGVAVGHVRLTSPVPVIAEHLAGHPKRHRTLPMVVIANLFVHPDYQRTGIGHLLLERARGTAWASQTQPVLAVVTPNPELEKFYETAGFLDCGTYQGRDGVIRAYLDPNPPAPVTRG